MQFRLRYGAHDIKLAPGEFVIGRADECQLALDDPMVSRRHAALRVTASGVVAVDLGSRNGVLVNGERIRSERALVDGDRVKVGGHELVLQIMRPEPRRLSTRTLQAVDVRDIESTAVKDPKPASTTPPAALSKAAASLQTLAQLANKALGLGRSDEAERILLHPLGELLKEIRTGRVPSPQVLERAASYAIRLAVECNKAFWIDWAIEAYHLSERLMPAQVVEDLHGAMRKVRPKSDLLEAYVASMRQASASANERLLLQRIEGLVQLGKG